MPRITRDFDNKSLLDDLKSSIKNDKMYWIRNDAKIRASVTSQNYDEFRNIVDAAHLTSVQKSDIIKRDNCTWNPYAKETRNE